MDGVRLDNDQKLITITEQKYDELVGEIKRLSVIKATIDITTIVYGHGSRKYEYTTKIDFTTTDKVDELLGGPWHNIKTQLENARKEHEALEKSVRVEFKELNDLYMKKAELALQIAKHIEEQKFVPKWIVRLFGRKKSHSINN